MRLYFLVLIQTANTSHDVELQFCLSFILHSASREKKLHIIQSQEFFAESKKVNLFKKFFEKVKYVLSRCPANSLMARRKPDANSVPSDFFSPLKPLQKTCSSKFRKIHQKKLVAESLV